MRSGALMATRPDNMPLHMIVVSGFRPFSCRVSMAAIVPAMPANAVLTTMALIRRSAPAKAEPEVKPNQPKAKMRVPTTTIGK